jgi:8-oxo-dGTP pyrophosphatase MutT (NUDIX family)
LSGRAAHNDGAVKLVDPLRRVLAERERIALPEDQGVRCAVLVPLLPDGELCRVVYTVRTEHLPDHRGQVAFPGGKHHASDPSLADTALREAQEEVGIVPGEVELLGRLDDVYTMATHYVVTPFVGVLRPGTRFEPNPEEVADLFTLSVDELSNPKHHGTIPRNWGDEVFHVDVINVGAGAHDIWGLTLNITRNLLDCIERASSARALR